MNFLNRFPKKYSNIKFEEKENLPSGSWVVPRG